MIEVLWIFVNTKKEFYQKDRTLLRLKKFRSYSEPTLTVSKNLVAQWLILKLTFNF